MKKTILVILSLLFFWCCFAESPAPASYHESSMRLRTCKKVKTLVNDAIQNIETDFSTGQTWFWTKYTYTTGTPNGNNIVVNGTIPFGVAPGPGDVIEADVNNAIPGWRCLKLMNLTGGEADPSKITFRFINGATMMQNTGAQIQESQLYNVYGIRIVKEVYQRNSDVAFRLLGTTQPAYITLDSCLFTNFPTLFSENTSSMPAFGNDTTKMFRHFKITNTTFDTTQNQAFGDFINIGAITTKDFWWDVEIANNRFLHMYSSGGPSHAGTLTNVLAYNIHDNYVDGLGMIANPNGHADVWNIQGGFGDVWNNIHTNIFGNDFRVIGIYDMPQFGIVGYTRMFNNLIHHKRKYPGFEPRDNPSDITTLSPYVRKRSRGDVDNNTFYSMAAGTGLNPPSAYTVAVYDWYGIDSVFMHNNLISVVNDTTWAGANVRTLALGVGGSPVYVDSSNNVIAQFFSTSGLTDTATFRPIKGGRLNGRGTTLGYFTTDFYKNARTGPWDIGAVISQLIGKIPCKRRIRIKP